MKTVPLSCNHCGAPLSVPETARFVTCGHCHAQLAIHHEGAAVFTEVLGEIADRTANIETHLAEMRMEKELERVDAAWEKEKREMGVGDTPPPNRGATWFFCIALSAIGTAFVWRLSSGRHAISRWTLLLPLTIPWFIGWLLTMRLDRYEESEGFYRRIRQTILHRRGRPKRFGRTGAELRSSQSD